MQNAYLLVCGIHRPVHLCRLVTNSSIHAPNGLRMSRKAACTTLLHQSALYGAPTTISIPSVTRQCIGHLGCSPIGQMSNFLPGQVTNPLPGRSLRRTSVVDNKRESLAGDSHPRGFARDVVREVCALLWDQCIGGHRVTAIRARLRLGVVELSANNRTSSIHRAGSCSPIRNVTVTQCTGEVR